LFSFLFSIYHLVSAAAACFRQPAHNGGHYDFIYLFIICLLFSACCGCMREASSSNMIPPIFLILYYYYYLVSPAAACVKHPAGHANIICLFINYYLFII